MEMEAARPYDPSYDATATLILRLQHEDIQELLSADKGKGRDAQFSDAHLALATYQQELQTMDTILSDRCMSRSLTRAIITDAALVNESLTEESTAASDRALAHSIAGINTVSAAPPQRPALVNDLNDCFVARLAAQYVSGGTSEEALEHTTHSDAPAAAESSASAASRPNVLTTASRHCTACNSMKPLSNVCQTPCGHVYCKECIQTLFELSAADETLFPPRCCRQAIPLSSIKLYLSSAAVQAFEKKSVGFQTLDRTYCSRQACSNFILPANITGERATCEDCGTQTYTICKSNAHDGDCPHDDATQQLLETAREQGWQRCYACRRVVELDIGCNHITCPCGAQFCYACGQRWKTCPCDQWNEGRLLARANQVVDRHPALPAAADRERQVDQAAAELRQRHDCAHDDWRYTAGPHQCEECYQHLTQFIFECQQCRILACYRCKTNRL